MAKVVVAFVLVASLMPNSYFYFAPSTINNDIVEAGIVQAPASTSLVSRPQMTVLGNNVTTVAISAGQARGSRAAVAGTADGGAGGARCRCSIVSQADRIDRE